MNRRLFLHMPIYVFLIFVLSSCMCQKPGPRDPSWGRDVCIHCRMTIDDRKFATQLVGPGNQWRYFDDLGCALEMMRDEKNDSTQLYVLEGDAWVSARMARYNDGFKTPMNFGYAPVRGGSLSFEDVNKAILSHREHSHE